MFVVSSMAQQFRMSPCLYATRLIQHSQNTILDCSSISRYYSRYHQRCSTLEKRNRVSCSSSSSSGQAQGGSTPDTTSGVGGDKVKRLPPVKRITRDDVTIQFARSSGAGGQNVNKVNTKVDMRLHLGNAGWLDSDIADAVRRMEKKRINKDDELVIMSQRTRSQLGNIEDALEKMQEILDHAHLTTLPIEEDPEKKKQIDAQLKRGNEVRLKKKQLKGDKKKERRSGKNIKDW